MIKLSIIVAIYNLEKCLKKCLDSLIKQQNQEIEIICINDGSTDSSKEILEEYELKDRRIKIINKKMVGFHQQEMLDYNMQKEHIYYL